MATRSCPECGAQYVASVRRCIDCDVVLVDDPTGGEAAESSAVSDRAPLGDGDEIGYELEGWGNQLKVALEGMLENATIPRVWEAGALVVPAEFEARVDELIATLEGAEVDEVVEGEQVAFEIEGLDSEAAAELDAQLLARGLPHSWSEEGDLLVAVEHEEEVSEIIDTLLDSFDSLTADGSDGLAANSALSDLYLTLDRLHGAPHDAKLADRLATVTGVISGLGVPYGFGASDWSDLKARLNALADLLAEDPTRTESGGESRDEAESPTETGQETDSSSSTADDSGTVDHPIDLKPGVHEAEVDGESAEPLTWTEQIRIEVLDLRDQVRGWI